MPVTKQFLWHLTGMAIHGLVLSGPWIIARYLDPEFSLSWAALLLWCVIVLVGLTESIVSRRCTSRQPVRVFGESLSPSIGFALLIVFWLSLMSVALCNTISALSTAVGIGLVSCGVCFRLAAILKLRAFFISELGLFNHHPLITDGIYSRTRNPAELGTLTLALGTVVYAGSTSGAWMFLTVLMPLITWRIFREEGMLKEAFSTHYDDYQQHTPRLIPFPR
ncbi:MAG: isoprenylcysteine carboxylmethyltransferase family protein [Acidobacteria bacterium]|nr:isoprenylcysteine carboxylmethyltransferase family protein [Acidobacteriota bacterium]